MKNLIAIFLTIAGLVAPAGAQAQDNYPSQNICFVDGDWAAAAALEVRPNTLPQVQAITYFARGESRRRQAGRAA
jgi:hypothetical protein